MRRAPPVAPLLEERVALHEREGAPILVLGVVQGLVSEAERVRDAFTRLQPRSLALAISAEALAGLRRHVARPEPESEVTNPEDGEGWEYEAAEALTDAEIAYGIALQQYGKVRLPPPDLIEGILVADAHGVPVFGVDLSEEQYEDVFTKEVGAFSLLRYSRRARKLSRKPPAATSAAEFALRWDAALVSIRGYDAVERARERRIAQATRSLAEEGEGVLLVVEVARARGVVEALRASGETGR